MYVYLLTMPVHKRYNLYINTEFQNRLFHLLNSCAMPSKTAAFDQWPEIPWDRVIAICYCIRLLNLYLKKNEVFPLPR